MKTTWEKNIRLNPDSKVPIYRQIRNGIVRMVDQGLLKNGDILCPERKLSERLQVSRGTVRKAYAQLQYEGLVVSRQGGHYYVSGASKTAGMFSLKAKNLFSEAISELMEDGQLPDDIFSSFKHALLDILQDNSQLHIGIIECRAEVEYVFSHLYTQHPDAKFTYCLLDDLHSSSVLVSQLYSCDLILTTATHYFEVCKCFPMLAEKLLEVVTLWSQETVAKLSTIPPKKRIGVLYSSSRTVYLVKSALKYFDIDQSCLDELNEKSIRLLEEFVLHHDIIIAEPPSSFFSREDLEPLRRRFEKQGGSIIAFGHYVDTDSDRAIARAISTLKWDKLGYKK